MKFNKLERVFIVEKIRALGADINGYFLSIVSSSRAAEPAEDRRLVLFLLGLSAVLFLLRSINLFSYPAEYMWDELKDISYAVFRHTGKVGFFYTDFGFAPGNMHHQIMSLFTGLIKENIQYYRLIGLAYSSLFIAGLYLLTKKLFNRKTAAIAVFMMCVSYSGFFNSRMVLCNNLVPMFMVFCLYFLLLVLNNNVKYIVPYLAVFILGFNTYYNWMLVIPVIVWITADSYLSGKMKNKALAFSVIFMAVLAGVLYMVIFWNAFVPKWNVENMAVNHGGLPALLSRIGNMKYIFFSGHPRADHFLTDMSFINFQEAILLIAGCMIAFFNIKRTEYRVLIISLIVFMAAVIVVPTTHQMRLIQAGIPISIITALPLSYIFKKSAKIGWVVTAFLVLLYASFISHYFHAWDGQLVRNDTNKQFALYMNRVYGNDIVYYETLDFEEPEYTLFRMKGYYSKGRKQYAAIKLNAYWLKDFMGFCGRYYPEDTGKLDVKVFFGHDTGRYLFALICFPVDSKLGAYISECESIFREPAGITMDRDFEKHLRSEPKSIFRNTLIKEKLAMISETGQKPEDALRNYLRNDFPFWAPADFHNKISKLYYFKGDNRRADLQKKIYLEKKQKFYKTLESNDEPASLK